MSLTVKAYLQRAAGGEPEIRRFSVDQDVSSSYTYLNKKITQVFVHLSDKPYKLYWKDPEGESVAFSSDDELMDALGFVSDGILRIHISEMADGAEDPKPRCRWRQVLHPGVMCDGCEGPVRGLRYKCSVCPDYDLCMGCKGTGLHSEHQLETIHPPRGPAMCKQFGPAFGFMHPHHPFHPGHHHQKGMKHCPPGCTEAGQSQCTEGGPPGSTGSGCPGEGQHGGRPTWGPWMRRNWRRWWRETHGDQCPPWKRQGKTGEKPGKSSDGEKSGENPQEAMDESSSSGEEGFNQYTQNHVQGGEDGAVHGEDATRHIEEGVAALHASHCGDGKGHPCHKEAGGHFMGPFGPWPWLAGWGGRGRGHCRGGRPGGRGRCPMKWNKQRSDDAAAAATAAAAEEEKQAQHQEDAGKTPADVDMEGPSAPVADNTRSEASTKGDTTKEVREFPDKDWTVIEDNAGHHGNTKEVKSTSHARLYPQVEPQSDHPNPKITHALVQLGTMGIHNEGGWLTRLLEVVDGDINRALDAIKANRK